MGNRMYPSSPIRTTPAMSSDVATGRWMKGSDIFVGLEATVDQRLAFFDLPDFYGANFHRLIVLNHEDVRAVGSALHRGGRHNEAALARGQQEARVHELARPKPQVVICEGRLEP